jgi:hypothetical protein
MVTPEVSPKIGFHDLLALDLTVLLPVTALFASPRPIAILKRLLWGQALFTSVSTVTAASSNAAPAGVAFQNGPHMG